MTSPTSLSLEASDFIDSAQVAADDSPRFRIPARPTDPRWADAAAREADGGVAAEVRVFLDEQMSTGDLLLDFAPGFGFVALGAATAPNGVPTVLAAGLTEADLMALQDAAAEAGAWIEGMDEQPWAQLDQLVDDRLDAEGRVFVHAAPADLRSGADALIALSTSGRLLALCVSDPFAPADWPAHAAWLERAGLRACALSEQHGEVQLVPIAGMPTTCLIAVPALLFENAESNAAEEDIALSEEVEVFDEHVFTDAVTAYVAPTDSLRDGFSLIAPHSRTGYGVVGANLLDALQRRSVPVAFFAMGPIDRSLTDNASIDSALEQQGSFPAHAPSVRIAQQFDLAMHVGHGPRVGFTIFESDAFTPRELHHMRSQDALIVCSPWARDVCFANGLTDRAVHVVPLGVDRRVFHEGVASAGQHNETVFLQVGKLEPRKGQRELLRAFEAAFSPSDEVRLIFACHNPFMNRGAFDDALSYFRASPMAKRITILASELESARDVAQLMAGADCGVFPSRAEGWNLEALEMLSMGKPIIATAATAHTAYMTPANARLISIDSFEPAGGGELMGRWPAWGASQQEQLVEQLRAVHAQRVSGSLAVNTAGIETAKAHTWDASASALLDVLSTLS